MSGKKSASTTSPTVTPASDWKAKQEPMELPSGKFAIVRKASFRTFMQAGIIPNSLMATVQRSLNTGVDPNADGLEETPEQVAEMLEMMDNIAMFVFQEPKLHKVPNKVRDEDSNEMVEGPRDLDLVYIDEVDEDDKMFVFQFVTGGVKDLDQFRRETAEQLAAVQPGKALARPA